jgi:accessory colonization factor AcfC
MRRVLLARCLSLLMFSDGPSRAESMVRAFGRGSRAPAMKRAAEVLGKGTDTKTEVVADPTNEWFGKAKSTAT